MSASKKDILGFSGDFSRANTILDSLKQQSTNSPEIRSYPEGFADLILEQVKSLALPLAEEIETAHPNHLAGYNKIREMDDLATESPEISQKLGLEDNDIQLIKIILGSHDLGRIGEYFLGKETIREGIRHGALSAQFLDDNHLLDTLSNADRYCVLFAVNYHSEINVPVPAETDPDFVKKGYDYCYVLRDLDKMHLFFEDDKYNQAPGILGQLSMHFNTSLIELIKDPDYKQEATQFIQNFLDGKREDSPKFNTIATILSAPVKPSTIESIQQHQSANLIDINYSWSTYMAFRLAMIFDIKHSIFIEEIFSNHSGFIDPTLSFIKSVDPKSAEKIKLVLHERFAFE